VLTNLQENLEIFTNVNEIKVPIKSKDMNAATGATSVENDGKRIRRYTIGRNLTVRKGVIFDGFIGRSGRHGVKYECDEEEREYHH
jgi:hypothetical protein